MLTLSARICIILITNSKTYYPDQVDKPNLMQLIQEFIHGQQHPESSPHNIPDLPPFYDKITIYTSVVATFHAPNDLSGIGGMKHERIHAVNCWRNGPGHYDTLFINTAIDNEDQDRSEERRVGKEC